MIVISGALVLVALVLLIIGVVAPELNFVYASIVVSLASGVFLLIGILQRRRTGPPAQAAPGDAADGAAGTPAKAGDAKDDIAPVTAVVPAASDRQDPAEGRRGAGVAGAGADELDDEDLAGYVLIVPGRPRYHVDGCRYIAGKDVEELDVLDAREEGFTACGVCRPDEALEQEYDDDDGYDDDEDELDAADVPVVEPQPVAASASRPGRGTAAAPNSMAASVRIPSTSDPAATTPAEVGAGGADEVVVIPDRGTFHNAGCRYVRGSDGAFDAGRQEALGEGYQACRVCRP